MGWLWSHIVRLYPPPQWTPHRHCGLSCCTGPVVQRHKHRNCQSGGYLPRGEAGSVPPRAGPPGDWARDRTMITLSASPWARPPSPPPRPASRSAARRAPRPSLEALCSGRDRGCGAERAGRGPREPPQPTRGALNRRARPHRVPPGGGAAADGLTRLRLRCVFSRPAQASTMPRDMTGTGRYPPVPKYP